MCRSRQTGRGITNRMELEVEPLSSAGEALKKRFKTRSRQDMQRQRSEKRSKAAAVGIEVILDPAVYDMLEAVLLQCDPHTTLVALRHVCHRLCAAANARIWFVSHLPIPEVRDIEMVFVDGQYCKREHTKRELATDESDDGCERGRGMSLKEGWSDDLTTFQAAINKALESADPGGEVSWAEYDEGKAQKLMNERRWVSVEDFAEGEEVGCESEIGWTVSLERWAPACSRMEAMKVIRDYGGDEWNDDDGGDNEVHLAIQRRVWEMFVYEQPSVLVCV